MTLESPKKIVDKSAKYLFDALSEVKNFERLMPETIAKFEVTDADSFIFGLKGLPEIKLRMKEKIRNSKVILGAASEKLPFTLTATILEISENQSEVGLLFDGEFNAMVGMMIKGPISKFLENLAENMEKL
jgi:ribosome-associated toxin RatA of RatAB toxin-antitoxin module